MREISCEIIKDLLPNYIDNVLSDDGKELVNEHIRNCSNCNKEYEIISSNIDINTPHIVKINYLRKINLRFLIMLILLLVVTVISVILMTFYSEQNFEDGILTLVFLSLVFILIIIKFIVPLFGVVYGIVYLKNKNNKMFIIPIIICSVWLIISIYTYISNLIYY